MTENVLTLNEVAQLLGVPLHRLQYCIRKGKVKAPRKSLLGSQSFYFSEELTELRQQIEQKHNSEAVSDGTHE